jgi:para-nitrobenzyl esterase
LLATVALAAAGAACGAQPPEPTAPVAAVTTRRALPAGDVVGFAGLHGGHAWRGLPFAQPPLAELRWRAPQPLPRWQGAREALAFGAPCPQFASAIGGVPGERGEIVGSEDCLFLDVYAPAFAPEAVPSGAARLPVMVWIHGGGNTIGAARFYDGSALASGQNVIVVTIQYRLGALGWFRHASLREGASPQDASGNFGTLDQIRALEWVRDNVAAFGGDPGNVTIFGESAGARNVLALLTSPPAAGLFHRAIAQSGGTRSASLAEAENLASDREPGATTSSNEIVKRLGVAPAALREVSAEQLLRAYDASGIGMYDAPQIFPDGVVLPSESSLESFRGGRASRVPVLLGTNKDEEKLFSVLSPRYAWRVLGVLPVMKDEAAFLRDTDYRTRAWKLRGVDEPARALAAVQPGRVFAYRFDWDEEPRLLWADFGKLLGAAHGFEIPFVFGHWELGASARRFWTAENAPGREALSAAMQSYWAAFARDGAPGRGARGEQALWSAWDEGGDKYLVLDTPAGGGIRMSGDTESVSELVAEVEADATFADADARCAMLASIHQRAPEAFDFAAVVGGSCGPSSATVLRASAR